MTSRQIYEGVLIELNKVNAPSLLLEDFVYLFNKAINQYINKRYNIYDVNQQTTDDLRVLKASALLPVTRSNAYGDHSNNVISRNALYGAIYEVNLPPDYLHLLNCVCIYKVNKNFKCYDKDTYVEFGARKLTADSWSNIINNFYMKPTYKNPYYYIHNVNVLDGEYTRTTIPTNPYNDDQQTGTGFGTGTDKPIIYCIRDQFEKFLNGQDYQKESAYFESCVKETKLYANEHEYYTINKDGKKQAIVYNAVTEKFSTIDDNFTKIAIDTNTLYITASEDNLRIEEETMYANNIPLPTNNILYTTNFDEKYGKTTLKGGLPRTLKSDIQTIDLVEKEAVHRYGNASNVRMEIRYGKI